MKPQFVPPPVRSRHQGRQVAVWASAGAASITGTSAVRQSATKSGRIKGMPTSNHCPTPTIAHLAELNTRRSPLFQFNLALVRSRLIRCTLLAMSGFGRIDGMQCGPDLLAASFTAMTQSGPHLLQAGSSHSQIDGRPAQSIARGYGAADPRRSHDP
jgi:hypothetical protein